MGSRNSVENWQKKSSNWLHTPDYAIINYANPFYDNKHTMTLVKSLVFVLTFLRCHLESFESYRDICNHLCVSLVMKEQISCDSSYYFHGNSV